MLCGNTSRCFRPTSKHLTSVHVLPFQPSGIKLKFWFCYDNISSSLQVGYPTIWAKRAILIKSSSDSDPLLSIGSQFRDLGPYRDLLANLDPYWVFISLKRSLFLHLSFWTHKKQNMRKILYTFKKVNDNFFRNFSSVLNFLKNLQFQNSYSMMTEQLNFSD